jgi:arginyl-tRNA synthetase
MKKALHLLVKQSIQQLYPAQELPEFQIENTKDAKHGDYACNFALIAAKKLRKPPREIAQAVISSLPPMIWLEKMEIAGPGFINFTVASTAHYQVVQDVLTQENNFGKSTIGNNQKVLLEFISSNPTGPLHVGHGRGAAFGSSLANLLRTAGFNVDCEYYINDAGRQMEILAVSLWLRYLALVYPQHSFIFPDNGYQGDYVADMAKILRQKENNRFTHIAVEKIFSDLPLDEKDGGDKEIYIDAIIARACDLLGIELFQEIQAFATDAIMEDIKNDLAEFRVYFESWFSEKKLFDDGSLEKGIEALKQSGYTEEKEGALWFKATHFGDEKDRVLIRANGKPTYFASDVAYHWNKYSRGYEKLINVFGADHHGYITRLKAVVEALGKDPSALEVLLVQFAILYRGKERVSMSTRAGSFITLRQLREETGNDAARFFYIQRKSDQHLDFDLELAKSQSSDNPVYYVQYAHARICSIFKQLVEKKLSFDKEQGLQTLTSSNVLSLDQELQLAKALSLYPDMIENSALSREPHQIAHYLRELANHFHTYYNACVFLVDDEILRNARLCLIMATQQVLKNGLALLGVNAPEFM